MIVTACAYFAGKANPNYARHHRAVDCKGAGRSRRPHVGVLSTPATLLGRYGWRRSYEESGLLGEVLVTSAQIRAARGLLDWTVRDLAERSGVHRDMVSKIETGAYAGAPATLEAIRRTLEYAGVEFTNGDAPGVKLRKR